MKRTLITISTLLLLAFALTACDGLRSTGPLQTENINVAMPSDKSKTFDLKITLGAANINVSSGNDTLVQGTVEYNILELKPAVINSSNQTEIKTGDFNGALPSNVKNDWNLKLGQGLPLNLTVATGATKGQWDLGGLSLKTLNWSQGAADTNLRFSQTNPVSLDNFTLDSGAAKFNLQGLGNANIRNANFTAGVGQLDLSFDGKLSQDAEIKLKSGVAGMTIYSGSNPVRLIKTDGGLSSINPGSWSQSGETYTSPEWAKASGPKITIRVELSVGSLNLR